MSKMSSGQCDQPSLQAPAAPFAIGLMLETVQPAFASMMEVNGKAYASWMEINRQWAGFLSGRFQEDVALVHHLARCKDPQEIFGVYASFLQKAFADYQHEFTAMTQIGQSALAEVTTTAQKSLVAATQAVVRPAA